jgi:hypothetical protein
MLSNKCQGLRFACSIHTSSSTAVVLFHAAHILIPADTAWYIAILSPAAADTDVHHILIEAWDSMEKARGTLFVSIPTL